MFPLIYGFGFGFYSDDYHGAYLLRNRYRDSTPARPIVTLLVPVNLTEEVTARCRSPGLGCCIDAAMAGGKPGCETQNRHGEWFAKSPGRYSSLDSDRLHRNCGQRRSNTCSETIHHAKRRHLPEVVSVSGES
jgi:hypothetical protein